METTNVLSELDKAISERDSYNLKLQKEMERLDRVNDYLIQTVIFISFVELCYLLGQALFNLELTFGRF